jgi:phosphoglucomutase
MTAVTGHDPGDLYRELTAEFGEFAFERVDGAGQPCGEDAASRVCRRREVSRLRARGEADHGAADDRTRKPGAGRPA